MTDPSGPGAEPAETAQPAPGGSLPAPVSLPEPAPLTFGAPTPEQPAAAPSPLSPYAPATESPYAAPASPYGAPASPYAAPSSPYGAPASPYAAPLGAAPGTPPGGYAAPPGYPAYQGYYAPRRTNGLAIASMVVSISGALLLCAYGVGAIAGVVGAILGHVSRKKIRENDEEGDGFALAGIIVGWIVAAVGLAVIGLFVVAIVISINEGSGF